ncbi:MULTISPECIES: rod shape-determining protein MreD [Sphingobacterium]|uniref:Rod shape-determining protein MreD n=1 Tax=Sphingobacterium hotanense TaxID=649196 RepID=A0ABT7NMI2_9SPHI|nr:MULTISPECIES: rod shape-determining protein MreD [Sphingobacterium]MCT1524409.1 rod shape-determining protein MreD [Sphingobacterium hotanense]MDM1048381.1 rod shape-determining protein MreD [Sphingobacterium hotanense]
MGKVFIFNIVRFIVLIAMQVVLFKNIGYYNLATPFPYILIIFLLPIGTPNFILYLIAFLTGLTVDAFYDTIGVHAAASVALVWFRTFFFNITLDVDVQGSFETPSLGIMGNKWFFSYISIGTLIHHIVLLHVEYFSFNNYLSTLFSILLSSIFTILLIILMSLLFYKRKSRLLGN